MVALRSRPVRPSGLIRFPIVMAKIGLPYRLARSSSVHPIPTLTLAFPADLVRKLKRCRDREGREAGE